MTNQEILEKAISKAIEGGWDQFGNDDWPAADMANQAVQVNPDYSVYEIIFNHDFAKALWGECTTWFNNQHGAGILPKDGYQFHLQQMVIAVDPISYLEEHI